MTPIDLLNKSTLSDVLGEHNIQTFLERIFDKLLNIHATLI